MPGRSTLTATSVPSGSSREVHLRDRRARYRASRSKRRNTSSTRPAVDALQRRERLLGRERRTRVLQLRELVGDVGRQQIAARGEHLSELDEDRPERFQRAPQAHRARLVCRRRRSGSSRTRRTPRVRSCSKANSYSPNRTPTDRIFRSRKRRTSDPAHAFDRPLDRCCAESLDPLFEPCPHRRACGRLRH